MEGKPCASGHPGEKYSTVHVVCVTEQIPRCNRTCPRQQRGRTLPVSEKQQAEGRRRRRSSSSYHPSHNPRLPLLVLTARSFAYKSYALRLSSADDISTSSYQYISKNNKHTRENEPLGSVVKVKRKTALTRAQYPERGTCIHPTGLVC